MNMNTNLPRELSPRHRIHPLIATAAVAVVLVSATGIAAMTGLLPTSRAVTAPPPDQVASSAVALPAASMSAAPQRGPLASSNEPAAPVSVPRVPHHHVARPAQAPSYTDNGVQTRSPAQPAIDPTAGEIVAINAVQTPEQATGVGAVGGAVAGGLLGNQIGAGRGRVLATIAGAVGGGLAGNGIEHAVRKNTVYQVQVRMQDGSYRNFNYNTQPAFQIGERVHVAGDSLSAS